MSRDDSYSCKVTFNAQMVQMHTQGKRLESLKFLDKKMLQLERIGYKDPRRRLLNIIVNRATRIV